MYIAKFKPQPTVNGRPIPKHARGMRRHTPERLALVEAALRCLTSHHVIEERFSKEWKIQKRAVREYVTAVYRAWAEQAEASKDFRREQMRIAFQDFYEKTMRVDATEKGPDFKAAVTALDRLCKLEGVYEPDKVFVDGPGASFKNAEQIRERITELLKNPEVAAQLRAAAKTK